MKKYKFRKDGLIDLPEPYIKWSEKQAKNISLRKLLRPSIKNYAKLYKQIDYNIDNNGLGFCILASLFDAYSFLFNDDKERYEKIVNNIPNKNDLPMVVKYINHELAYKNYQGEAPLIIKHKEIIDDLSEEITRQLNHGFFVPFGFSDFEGSGHYVCITRENDEEYQFFENGETEVFLASIYNAFVLYFRKLWEQCKGNGKEFSSKFKSNKRFTKLINEYVNCREKNETLSETFFNLLIDIITNGKPNTIEKSMCYMLKDVDVVLLNFKALEKGVKFYNNSQDLLFSYVLRLDNIKMKNIRNGYKKDFLKI